MPLTRYKSNITILTEDLANSWFGGLYGQPEAASLDPNNPLVAGHVHDGQHLDGHAQKINLSSHVTGQLDGENLVNESVTQDKLDPSISFGSSGVIDLNPERGVLGMTNTYPVQLGVDGSGNLTGTTDTITFPPAPSSILIKKVISSILSYDPSVVLNTTDDNSVFVNIFSIKVNGIAIDSEGGIPLRAYSHNRFQSFDLNIPLSVDDVLTLEVGPITGVNVSSYISSFAITYDEQPSTLPSGIHSFIGTSGEFALIPASSADATATITVDSAPVSTFEIQFVNDALGFDQLILFANGGARTSGDDDFDATLGTTSAIATEIAAAINDSSNSFDDYDAAITAAAIGSDVELTISTGYLGNFTQMLNGISELSISDYFSGGTAGALTTATLETVTFDCTLRNIYIYSQSPLSVEAIKINGVNILEENAPGDLFDIENTRYSPNFNEALTNGDVITLDLINPTRTSAVIISAIVELPQ